MVWGVDSVEATRNSVAWRSNQVVCIAMRHPANLPKSTCYWLQKMSFYLYLRCLHSDESTCQPKINMLRITKMSLYLYLCFDHSNESTCQPAKINMLRITKMSLYLYLCFDHSDQTPCQLTLTLIPCGTSTQLCLIVWGVTENWPRQQTLKKSKYFLDKYNHMKY